MFLLIHSFSFKKKTTTTHGVQKFEVLMHPSLFLQYHKLGKDIEKVKQRMAEIANYVDKV